MNKESTSKKEDEIYCSECGKIIKRNAVICPHCGVQIKELKTKGSQSAPKNIVNEKRECNRFCVNLK